MVSCDKILGSLWISIVSLVCGILVIAAATDDGSWDKDSIIGFVAISSTSLSFGILGIIKNSTVWVCLSPVSFYRL